MRLKLLLFFFLGITSSSFSQNNILGLYSKSDGFSSNLLDLKPNNVCIIGHFAGCSPPYIKSSDTITWTHSGDTINLNTDYFRYSINGKEFIQKKFLYKDNFIYGLVYSDSILPKTHLTRVTDHYWILGPGYEKEKAYYEDGSLWAEVKKDEDTKLELIYHPNGKLKEFREYRKEYKKGEFTGIYNCTGTWYEFWENGNIKSQRTYRKGKILN